jgi:hypothetical protein
MVFSIGTIPLETVPSATDRNTSSKVLQGTGVESGANANAAASL